MDYVKYVRSKVGHDKIFLNCVALEYSLNLMYGQENAAFSPVPAALRQELRADTERKLGADE